MQCIIALRGFGLRKQPRDLALAIEDALTLHFRRVRGEHGRDARGCEPVEERLDFHARFARALERIREASGARRRAGGGVRAPAAVLLLVFGDVEKVREVAEGAHEVQSLLGIERVQLALELGASGLLAPELHRLLADALDALERLVAHLLADHFAQQAAEESAIYAEVYFLFVHPAQRIIDAWADSSSSSWSSAPSSTPGTRGGSRSGSPTRSTRASRACAARSAMPARSVRRTPPKRKSSSIFP